VLFRAFISHSLIFYRQNDLKGFEEFIRLGRELPLGPGGEPRHSPSPLPSSCHEGHGWPEALKAVRLFDERKALRLLNAAVRRDPKNPSFLILRGFLRAEPWWGSRRLSEGSIADFRAALALDPDALWARMGLGMALEMRRLFTQAAEQFEAASRLAPRWAWPRIFRGVCLWYLAEPRRAAEVFAEAARLDPRSDLPLLFEARAKADYRDRSLVKDLDRALRLAPDSGFALSWRGRAMFVLTRLPEALGDLRRSIELLPDYDRGWSWLGVSLLELGRVREAVPLLRRARALNPYYPTTLYPLSGALMRLKRWDEAGRILREAAAVDRAGVWVEHRISMSHPNPAALRSRADLDRYLEKRPRSAWALAWRGQTELLLQNYGRALGDLSRAAALDPKDPWARLWRGETLRRLGEWEAARADFDAALKLDKTLSWAHAGRAECLLSLGRPAAALAAVTRSLKLWERCGPACALRGRILLALGRPAEAAASLRRAVELHPQDRWTRRLLARAEAGGRARRAPGPRAEAAFEPDRLAEDAAALGLRACARALRRGDAGAALGSCADDRRRESRLYRLRGWLKLSTGDAAGAAEEASRALDETLDPSDAAALWLRARARAVLLEGLAQAGLQRGVPRA
jgi:tetratricopeptide (TPR) repeat protein